MTALTEQHLRYLISLEPADKELLKQEYYQLTGKQFRRQNMMLMTKKIKEQLIKNFTANVNREEPIDHVPVLKLFGGGSCTWLITEYDQENDILFGLCDLGMGFPEVGHVSFQELREVRFKPFGLGIERDRHFRTDKTLSQLADEATQAQRITA